MPVSDGTSEIAPSILCIGQDPSLLDTRAALLRRIGVEVQCANGAADALKAMESADFDLLMLCYSLPENEKQMISSAARRQPHSPLILLLSSLSSLDAGQEGILFDGISDTHPAVLTASVRDLLQRRAGARQSITSEIA